MSNQPKTAAATMRRNHHTVTLTLSDQQAAKLAWLLRGTLTISSDYHMKTTCKSLLKQMEPA